MSAQPSCAVTPRPPASLSQTQGKPFALATSHLKTGLVLFKLRVVLLLLAAALGGALLGADGAPSGLALLWLTVTGGLSAAGASAINQYLERERDTCMARTRQRPLAAGRIAHPWWVLVVGSAMVALAVASAWAFEPALGFFIALGAAIYLGVYTLWLKPRTVLNIVIGGAAGSCTVLSGGAAVGAVRLGVPAEAWAEPGVLALALLVFVWTPLHFWSLAMACRDDYATAGFPMLPVCVTPRQAVGWIALHSLATGLAALLMATHPALGVSYLIPVGLATLWLGYRTVCLLNRPKREVAFALFKFSNVYLGLVLATLIAISIWR